MNEERIPLPSPAKIISINFVLDPVNHERHSRVVHGIERHYYVLPYPGRFIWGATAGMLVNLHDKLSERC